MYTYMESWGEGSEMMAWKVTLDQNHLVLMAGAHLGVKHYISTRTPQICLSCDSVSKLT